VNDLELTPHARGTIVGVKAQPQARRNGLNGVHGGRLRVQVTAVAEQGRANAAVIEVLAEVLGIAKSRIELLSGGSSPAKRFLIAGLEPEAVRAALAAGI
jgi:uncharacterized protein (TIGR00251 family)